MLPVFPLDSPRLGDGFNGLVQPRRRRRSQASPSLESRIESRRSCSAALGQHRALVCEGLWAERVFRPSRWREVSRLVHWSVCSLYFAFASPEQPFNSYAGWICMHPPGSVRRRRNWKIWSRTPRLRYWLPVVPTLDGRTVSTIWISIIDPLFDFRERGGLFLSSFQFLLLPIRVAKDSLLEFFNFLLYFFFLSFVLFSLLEEKERNKQKADRYTPSSLRRGLEKWGEEVYDINIHIPILNTCIYLQKRMQI